MVGLSLAEEGPLVVLEEEAVEEGDMVVDMVVAEGAGGDEGTRIAGSAFARRATHHENAGTLRKYAKRHYIGSAGEMS